MPRLIWEDTVFNVGANKAIVVKTYCKIEKESSEKMADWETVVEDPAGIQLPFSANFASDHINAQEKHQFFCEMLKSAHLR